MLTVNSLIVKELEKNALVPKKIAGGETVWEKVMKRRW